MFNGEVRRMLAQVISSWQVLAVTVVLVIYISIVNRAAKMKSRRRPSPPPPKKRSEKTEKTETATDELGLEETVSEKKK